MNRRKEYKQYLRSSEWKEQKLYALERTSGFCQFCGDVAIVVHHTKYPKQFGEEHPNSLIPVCKRCHDIAHGVQNMKQLSDVTRMTDLSPDGIELKYLLSGGRVYASAKSWAHALKVPYILEKWFESGLSRTAMLKKDSLGGELEMSYLNIPVFRWHVVAEQLRNFDRQWYNNQFGHKSKAEQRDINRFHDNYERLVTWGYDLQERALNSLVNPSAADKAVTQDALIASIKEAVAPRLREHDGKLHEHDVVIAELQNAVPVLRDQEEFISVKQAVSEQGFDANAMPMYPRSKENLSGLTGRILKERRSEEGPRVVSRLDGQSLAKEVNTFLR